MQEDKEKFYVNEEWEIETDEGWKDFKGIAQYSKKEILEIILENNESINVSNKHGFIDSNDDIIFANESLGCQIKTTDGLQKVIEVNWTGRKEVVYDFIDVEDTHKYYTNNILSHNTHLVDDFWKSVYPIVSSSKKSKIFIASTANGTDNLFYKLYTGADKGENGWACDKILWNEIPGRDEKWKQQTISSIGSLEAFSQEFDCQFFDSGESSVNDELFAKLNSKTVEPKFVFDDGKYLLWDEPRENGIYIASVDTSEGLGRDASVVQVLDYSDLTNIKQVAVYHNTEISPYNFTEKVFEILQHWGNPLVCIERNNSGGQVVDILKNTHDYENIVSWGGSLANRKKQQLGIISHTNTKYKAITNMRYWINELESVQINDKRTVKELKNYVKAPNGTWNAKKGYHDDLVTSLMWNLIILIDEIVETYFEVIKKDTNNKPLELQQMDFGIKYFMNPTSLYTNEKEGLQNTLPVIIGNASSTNSEIDQLLMQGYKVWQP